MIRYILKLEKISAHVPEKLKDDRLLRCHLTGRFPNDFFVGCCCRASNTISKSNTKLHPPTMQVVEALVALDMKNVLTDSYLMVGG